MRCEGYGVLLTMAYIGRLHPKRGTFFRPQVYERISGISLVLVYERDTKSVISVNKGLRDACYGCEKVEKLFWFCDLFIFLRQRLLQQSKGIKCCKLDLWKGSLFQRFR